MSGDLELAVVQEERADLGYVAGFAITDRMIVAAGGTSSHAPTVLASSNARHFEPRKTPRQLGLRDVLAVGDAVWTCGEYGQLAMSRDHGATWKLFETGTDACLFGLAVAPDGAVWVVGDAGYAARVLGERPERVDLGTNARLAAVYALRDEVIVLCGDGALRRWRDGQTTVIATGAKRPLTAFATTRLGTWVVIGDGGFVARSPDGAWFSRATTGVEIDLEGIAALADGRLVVAGDRGHVLASIDDGRTWKSVETSTTAHLWSVERFGGGVLIGGDGGLVIKLAPPGDATWQDRVDVFGGGRPLDEVFVAGPDEFVARGLARHVELLEQEDDDEQEEEEVDAEFDEDDDDDDDEDDDDDDDDEEGDEDDAFAILNEDGNAESFEQAYGVPLPPEVARLREIADGHDCFEELELEDGLLPDVREHNLFELLVRRDQQAYLGTGLVEAFCGVFCLGTQGNGDTYHVELYEWDGPRQVLHHDHETHAFTGVFADSVDSLAYLAALMKANEERKLSRDAFAIGLRKLRGKVAPTWHFSIDEHDPEFVALDAKRRDTEFFFYRSRWICALLKHDGVTEVADIPRLFMADFNQVVPQDQLPARYEACEKIIPTALYSMWRAFLFEEPEIVPYLEIGRRHKARLVRDSAKLIDELRAGRNELGTIKDIAAHVAAFRALDLDPRRAEQRKAEADARAKHDSARKDDVAAELARTSAEGWSELAWRWLDDGVAHRALLEQLDRTPALAAQIAALDELRELPDGEREVALPRLADALAPELEAVLVGSLLRDDRLDGVLAKPSNGNGHKKPDEDESPGWAAIDRALEPVYHGAEPHAHYGTVVPYMLGGNDPIHGISIYLRDEPVPHFHFVTYGFTDLFTKETDDPAESGFGFELTLRLCRAPDERDVPMWALNFLQNLGRYVFGTGNRFGAGHKMGLNGPIALDHDTKITAIAFADDPELGDIESKFGKARFIQIVGITDAEYRLIQEWSTTGLVEILRKKLPVLVTDLARGSVLDDAVLAAEVRARVDAEGSSEDLTFGGEMKIDCEDERVRIELGALYAAALPRAMRGRLRHGRSYTLRGRERSLHLEPGDAASFTLDGDCLTLVLPAPVTAEVEARLAAGLAGTYRFETWPALEIVVTISFIRDQAGQAIEVRGVADEAEAKQLIDAENARLGEGEGDDDEEDEDEDEDDEDDDAPPHPDHVRAALAMTERALAFAPHDEDAQFTHAMLMIEGERAGLEGATDQLLETLPRFAPGVRVNVAVRMGRAADERFADAVDVALGEGLPDKIFAEGGSANVASFGDVAQELFSELGAAILEHAPDRMTKLVPLLPGDVTLLADLAYRAIQAERRADSLALYDRLLSLPLPDEGDERTSYLRALNNACIQAHAAKAYELAVKIADRAQPIAHENPYIYHSAACAYAATGDYAKALEQVRLAVEHDYEHLAKVEIDGDLGPLLEWPEFKALFRDWHARQEGN
jgi:photosystem II stability/assembly factor-like uncharacterized protein/tetratricopeptide (TPR) repeat protein